MAVLRPGSYANGDFIEKNGCYVWIPKNIAPDAAATIVNPGQDMTWEMINRLYNPLVVQGVNQIVVIPKYNYYMYGTNAYGDASNRAMNAIYNTCNERGISLTGINTLGSSAGDRYALVEFVQAARRGVDNGYCVITGASTIRGASQFGQPFHSSGNNSPNHAFLTDAEYEAIRGKTVYAFEGKNGERMSYIQALVRHGVNVVLVECKSSGHDQLSWNPLRSNVFNLLDGNPDSFLSDSNYSFWKCVDPNNMAWIKMDDEEVREVSSANYMEVLLDKYKELNEFADHYRSSKGDTLASNLAYVSNAMDAIKSQITEHTDLNYESPSGEAKIIGSLYKATNYYGAVTNVLYGNLGAETEAVYGIANAIFKMDGCASVIAETSLTSGVQAVFNATNPSVSVALEELKARSGELFDTAKTAVMADGRYSELTGLLGDKAAAGSVGKVSVSSLESAINSIVPSLENEINKATGIKASVDEFMTGIGASNILQGETWEAVKTNMGNYSGLLDCNVKAATFISDTIKTAMGLVVDYIQNAAGSIKAVDATEFGNLAALDELDDSKLGELNQAIQTMTDRITEQEEFIKEKEALPDVCDSCLGADGKTYEPCNCRRPYSAADMQGWKETLQKYIDIKTDLNTYKGVLEGFAPVVAQAQDIINDAVEQVKSAYENPTTDTKGNQTFNSDFSLDLSKYGIDDSKDYKKLIDDYYAKLNPPEPEKGSDPELNDTGLDDGDRPGSPGGPGGPGAPSDTTPERQTERQTEPATERETKPIEVPTMAPTEPRTSPQRPKPEDPTEFIGEDDIYEPSTSTPHFGEKDEPQIVKLSKKNKGNVNYGPTNLNNEGPEIDMSPEIVDTPEEVIIDDTGLSDYQEAAIEAPIVEEQVPVVETPASTHDNKGLKSMGIASGIGMAVGAVALGAHSIIKNKEKQDEEEDYGYDK